MYLFTSLTNLSKKQWKYLHMSNVHNNNQVFSILFLKSYLFLALQEFCSTEIDWFLSWKTQEGLNTQLPTSCCWFH